MTARQWVEALSHLPEDKKDIELVLYHGNDDRFIFLGDVKSAPPPKAETQPKEVS